MTTEELIQQIDAEIGRLEQAKATLTRFLTPTSRTSTRRQGKTTGTESIVLAVMRDGADTLAAITKAAKVKPNTARSAVLALEHAGKVQREGKGSLTRYRPA